MTYVVNDACIRCKYMDCVEVCPVDCFYEGDNMLVIHPDECIDCGVCEPECPVEAILPDTEGTAEKCCSYLPGTPSKDFASGGGSFFCVMFGQDFAKSALSLSHRSSPGSVSGLIASAGHSGSHTPQSMHSSGWMTSMFSPS